MNEFSDPQDQIVCPSCDSPADPHAVVCAVCGTVLASGIESDQATELLRRLRDVAAGPVRPRHGHRIWDGRASPIRGRRQSRLQPRRSDQGRVGRRRRAPRPRPRSRPLGASRASERAADDAARRRAAARRGGDAARRKRHARRSDRRRRAGAVSARRRDRARHRRRARRGARAGRRPRRAPPEKIHLDRDGNAIISGFMLGQFPSGDRDAPLPNSIGSPAYMAFEQRHNLQTIDGRADQFSLAVDRRTSCSAAGARGAFPPTACSRSTRSRSCRIAPSRRPCRSAPARRSSARRGRTRATATTASTISSPGSRELRSRALPPKQLARVDHNDVKRRSPVWILAPLGDTHLARGGHSARRPENRGRIGGTSPSPTTGCSCPVAEQLLGGPSVDPSTRADDAESGFEASKCGRQPRRRRETRASAVKRSDGPPRRWAGSHVRSLSEGPRPPTARAARLRSGSTIRSRDGSSRVQEGRRSRLRARSDGIRPRLRRRRRHRNAVARQARRDAAGGAVGSRRSAAPGDSADGFLAISIKSGRTLSVFVDGILRGKTPLVWKPRRGQARRVGERN